MVSEQRRGVLITGGTGGLGGAVTRAFVDTGDRVVTTYTTREKWGSLRDLKSAFLATRAALKHVPDGGRIVNVGTLP